MIAKWYQAHFKTCLIKDNKDSDYNISSKSYHENIDKLDDFTYRSRKELNFCGSIGYFKNRKIHKQWTIKILHKNLSVVLNVKYLNVAYFGGECTHGFLSTVNPAGEKRYCGYRKNLFIFSSGDLMVQYLQHQSLLSTTGFFATFYSTYDSEILVSNFHKMKYYSGSRFVGVKVQYKMHDLRIDKSKTVYFTWHIIVERMYVIRYNTTYSDCLLYDGPGRLSKRIHLENNTYRNSTIVKHTSGYHFFIVQKSSFLKVNISKRLRSEFQHGRHVTLRSSASNNVIFSARSMQGYAIMIKRISIHSHEIIDNFPNMCQYGGLFVYTINNHDVMMSHKLKYYYRFKLCEVDIDETLHYTIPISAVETRVDVFMFGGYSEGFVEMTFKKENCRDFFISKDILMPGCNQHVLRLRPDDQYHSSLKFPDKGQPISLSYQTINTLYFSPLPPANASLVDGHVFGWHKSMYSVSLHHGSVLPTRYRIEIDIAERKSNMFISSRLVIVRFHDNKFCERNVPIRSISVISALFYEFCGLNIVGEYDYTINMKLGTQKRLSIIIDYEYECSRTCKNALVIIEQYDERHDSLIEQRFQQLPVKWTNAYSLNAFKITLSLQETCSDCVIFWGTLPSSLDTAMKKMSDKFSTEIFTAR